MRKEIYKMLCERLGNIPEIKYIDLWNHNVEFIEQEDNWERPAVFVELCPINWEATVVGMRYVTEAKVNLHVVTDWVGSSAANSDQREESLTVFDLLEKIHQIQLRHQLFPHLDHQLSKRNFLLIIEHHHLYDSYLQAFYIESIEYRE